MAVIGEMHYLTIGDNTYSIPTSGGSTVSITRSLTSGTKSATITVDGTSYDIYSVTVPTNISAFTNDSGYITSADVPEGASAYTGTISAVGTSASSGSNNGFARGDHVHNITSSTITSALGYTPYNSTNPNGYVTTDTKNTAGSTNSTSKLFLVGATSQAANPQTYSNSGLYYSVGLKSIASSSDDESSISQTPVSFNVTVSDDDADSSLKFDMTSDEIYFSVDSSGTSTIKSISLINDGSGSILYLKNLATPTANTDAATKKYVDDSIPTTLPASDVYAWAKAATKPTYTASEVGALPSTTIIPSITLNGSSTTSPSFYAPTGVGTSGQYLKSNGSGAPSWIDLPKDSMVITVTQNGDTRTADKTNVEIKTAFEENKSIYLKGDEYDTNIYRLTHASIVNNNSFCFSTIGLSEAWGNYTAKIWKFDYDFDNSNNLTYTENTIEIPLITLNGSSNVKPSFYAPTTAGTSGYYLKSNGSGAPSWTSFPTIPTKVSDLTNDNGFITSSDIPEKIFIATYNSTSYADVLAAYNAGKMIICKNSDYYTALSLYSNSTFTFYYFRMGTGGRYSLASTGWSTGSLTYINTDRTINGKSLSTNITLDASDVSALPSTTTIPSITLNGSSTTSPSFYAPTTAGTDGYVLTSNGSGAPSWEEVFAIVNYGEDTFAEVQALYEQCDGRIICKKAGAVNGSYDYFPLVESSSTSFSFIGFYGSASCQFVMLSSTLGWSTTYRSIQKSITTSSSDPTSSDGVDGDIWIKYTV